jgi:hypothetical protein
VNLTMTGVMAHPQMREVIRAPGRLRTHLAHLEVLASAQGRVTHRISPLWPMGLLPLAIGHGVGPRPSLSPGDL